MSPIGDSGHVPYIDPTQAVRVGAASNAQEAQQMVVILGFLYNMSYQNGIAALEKTFASQMHQQPIPLAEMEKELNTCLSKNGWNFQWSLTDDQKNPGESFMKGILALAQNAAGSLGPNNKIQPWVTKIANYINTGPWNADSISTTVNQFLGALNQLQIFSPFQPVSPTLFGLE